MWGISRVLLFSQYLFAITRATPTYDYVIVGGGTAGLTIAARLTEDPEVSVIVLEAGNDHSNDTNVLSPGLCAIMYGDPEYDWNYSTVPQIYANGQVVAHPRGKQLGGSSAINLMFWTHASRRDIDNWGSLGNANWSWDALQPYYKRSEEYIVPSKRTENDLQTEYVVPGIHGTKGPIINTFPDIYGPLDEAWSRTYEKLGLAVQSDPRDGLALGGYTNLISMNPKGRSRSYAATAYYLPASKRPNLKVITGALVEKILLKKSSRENRVTAIGAQYIKTTTSFKVQAKREVILSAGSIGSPHILELSGIGNSDLLSKYGINVAISNENVGENLQDHIYVPIGYEVTPGVPTLDDFKNSTYFNNAYEEYITNATGPLATTGASSGLLSCPQIGCAHLAPGEETGDPISPSLAKQYKLLSKYFQTEAVTQELTVTGGMSPQYVNDTIKLFTTTIDGNFFTMLGVLEHPFSRGSVHIQSSDPATYPQIDPRYLSHPFDLKVLSKIALHLQEVAKTAPLSNLLKGNGTVYQPGYFKLNDSNVDNWVRQYLQSEYHPAGTCSMMPRDMGGVVDANFKVYGAENLRVIDASVFPLLPRGNLQTLVYALAERAADWIKEDARGL